MENQNSLSRLTAWLTACLITLFGTGLILCSKAVSAAAAGGIALCARIVIPSLFPFMVLSSLCLSTGFGEGLSRLFARPMELLFHLPGQCAPALILGLIGGYPVGARTAFDLYDRKLCSREECSCLLTFCSCCGPAFLCSAVGIAIFDSLQAGLLLWFCHILSALLIGFVQGRFLPAVRKSRIPVPATHTISFSRSFTHAVSSSFSAMLNVCGFVIFFAALMALLEETGGFAALEKLLSLPACFSAPLLRGLLEMTNGITALGSTSALTFPQAMALSALVCGWGGFSVHGQVLSLREDRDIPMRRYFAGKCIHGLLSSLMTYIASFYCLPGLRFHSVFFPEPAPTATVTNPLYYILVCGVYLTACLAVTGLVLWLDRRDETKDSCQKNKKTV